jgi:hypothetical protein
MILTEQPKIKQGIQFQDTRDGSQGSGTSSRSEAMDWARGGCGGHFDLFSTSLGGQTAELVTGAG